VLAVISAVRLKRRCEIGEQLSTSLIGEPLHHCAARHLGMLCGLPWGEHAVANQTLPNATDYDEYASYLFEVPAVHCGAPTAVLASSGLVSARNLGLESSSQLLDWLNPLKPKESLVAGACNHPNVPKIPFSFELYLNHRRDRHKVFDGPGQ